MIIFKYFNPKVQEQINRDSIKISQYIKCTKRYEEDEKDLNNNQNINNNYRGSAINIRQYEEQNMNNLGNNNPKDNNKKLTYQENNYMSNMSSINNKSNNNDNSKIYTNMPNNSQFSVNNQNYMGNNTNFNNSNNTDDNLKTYTNLPNKNQYQYWKMIKILLIVKII